ncbi:MAG: phosphonate C-P lyase system protein PhnH [Gammaproteobacteria bacterium]|nr:phosphonate C-P lyase system protein PhnH [Gammaproteobacteria bacterium]
MTGLANVENSGQPRPGFKDPVFDAQRTFRALMSAMANPGTVQPVPAPDDISPVAPAAMALLLTLLDHDTALWTDLPAAHPLEAHLRFHCGARLTGDPGVADFALICSPTRMPALMRFGQGSDEYPERSCTLIVQSPRLDNGRGWTLRGPGIADRASLATGLYDCGLPEQLRANLAAFPKGVDLVFVHGRALAAVPRTTRVED